MVLFSIFSVFSSPWSCLLSLSILPLPVAASPVRSSLFILWENSKFPCSLLSLPARLILPRCCSLYVILLLKIRSWIPSVYSLRPNSLLWHQRPNPFLLAHCLQGRGMEAEAWSTKLWLSGQTDRQTDRHTESGPGSDVYNANYLCFQSLRLLIPTFGIIKLPTLWVSDKT